MMSFTRPPPEEDLEAEPTKVSMQTIRLIDKVLIESRGFPMSLFSFDVKVPEIEIIPPEDHELGGIFVTPETAEFHNMDKVHKYPLSYMF